MASISANTADDVGGEVALLGAVVLSVANLTAVLTGLVLVISEGTVEGGKFSQLVSLELVLTFGDGGSGLDDIVHQLLGFVDLVFGVGHDQAV